MNRKELLRDLGLLTTEENKPSRVVKNSGLSNYDADFICKLRLANGGELVDEAVTGWQRIKHYEVETGVDTSIKFMDVLDNVILQHYEKKMTLDSIIYNLIRNNNLRSKVVPLIDVIISEDVDDSECDT
jgi:hypothetical protein